VHATRAPLSGRTKVVVRPSRAALATTGSCTARSFMPPYSFAGGSAVSPGGTDVIFDTNCRSMDPGDSVRLHATGSPAREWNSVRSRGNGMQRGSPAWTEKVRYSFKGISDGIRAAKVSCSIAQMSYTAGPALMGHPVTEQCSN
jgi:hypothetical protein